MAYETFTSAKEALRSGETSHQDLVSHFLSRIDADNARLNIFVQVDREGAMARASELDALGQAAMDLPLSGLILGVKDVLCVKDQTVSCGSNMLRDFVSLYDATAIRRLLDAGAIIIGRTNCDEFAMGSSNENSAYGPVKNPRDETRVPGGSSGGSAAAVAAGMCHAALGTDTGGSIRQPAAYCGVVGLKPTYGRVSRFGLVAYASSFDCMGPFASTAEDLAAILQVMAGPDANDSTSIVHEVPEYARSLTRSLYGMTIGVPDEYFSEGLDPEIESAIRERIAFCESEGAIVKSVSLPHTEYGVPAYYVLATAEASSNLARYDGVRYGHRADRKAVKALADETGVDELEMMYRQTRAEGFGAEVKRRIMLGTYVLSSGYYDAYYGKAQQVRSLIRRDFDEVFREVDVLLTPATPGPAFALGSLVEDPVEMYLQDIYTVTANLAGIPGIVFPIGSHETPKGLPIGLQVLAPPFEEGRLLMMAERLGVV